MQIEKGFEGDSKRLRRGLAKKTEVNYIF